jgi:hypothetical protein
MLPGMPAPRPGVWPDVTVLGAQERVYTVMASFGGGLELKAGSPEEEFIAERLLLGETLTLEVSVSCDRQGHKLDKGRPVGLARLAVWDAAPAGEAGFLKLQSENRRVREAVSALELAADELSDAIGDHLRKLGRDNVPPKLEQAHWAFREALAAARPGKA